MLNLIENFNLYFYKFCEFLIFTLVLITATNCRQSENKEIKLTFKKNLESPFQQKIIPLKYSTYGENDELLEKSNIHKFFYIDYYKSSLKLKSKEYAYTDNLRETNFSEMSNDLKRIKVMSELKNDTLILRVDFNKNGNFFDDPEVNFGKKEKYKKFELIDSDEFINFFHQNFINNGINLTGRIIPFPKYYNNGIQDSITNILQVVYVPFGFWEGIIRHNHKDYQIAIQNSFMDTPKILISLKKDSYNSFSKPDYFPYLLGDKFYLDNDLFVLNAFDYENKILKIKKLDTIKNIEKLGIRKGFYIENIKLTDLLSKNDANIEKKLEYSDYIIIDFWGTWCKPCIELIPEIKKIKKEFKNVEILGIALDKDEKVVRNHILKEKIQWFNHFISFEEERDTSGMIQKLRINDFPTYLLIDKNRKILYRGNGKEGLKKILDILIVCNQ